MKHIMSLTKTKMRRVALAASGLVVGIVSLGMASSAGAMGYSNSYDNNSYNNSYGGYGSYSSYSSYGDGSYSSYYSYSHHNRHFTAFRWVYDPFLHRYILIGYNPFRDRWELVYSSDRYGSYGSYWYDD
jgi:hypothetical protein